MEVLTFIGIAGLLSTVGNAEDTGSWKMHHFRTKRSSSESFLEVVDSLSQLRARLDRIETTLAAQNGSGSEGRLVHPEPLQSGPEKTDQPVSGLLRKLEDLERQNQEFQSEYRGDVQRLLFNRDCEDFHRKGSTQSGVYVIYPLQDSGPVRVDCDMDTDGGGWTVIQRRGPAAALNFHRDWQAYRFGFGDPKSEFWLGNEAVHQLTTTASKGYSLLVELSHSGGARRWSATYRRFSLGSEDEGYALNLGTYSGNATDGLYPHHGRPFRTWDKEEDPPARACAWLEHSGWWYHPVKVARPRLHHICSYPLAGTNLNAPLMAKDGSGPGSEVRSQVMTLQPPPGQPLNQTSTLSFTYLGTMYWMDKDGRHFNRVAMKIRPNY